MKISVFVLVFIFFISCIDNKKEKIHYFNLKHIELNIPSEKIKDPHGILCAGENKLILLNGQTEKFFDLFDLNNGDCTSFGNKGRGPGEMLSAVNLFYDSVNKSLNSFDMMKGDYNSFLLVGIRKGKNNLKKLFSVDRNNGWPTRFIPFDDSLFLANGTFRHGRFGLFNNRGELIKVFGDFPDQEFNKKMSNMQLADGYNGMICSHPSEPLFVTVVPNSDLIEIYEKKDDDFIRLNADYQPDYQSCFRVFRMGKHWSTAACKNSIIGFGGCAVSDMFIFSSFSKGKLKDLLKRKISNPTIIRVFDWQGKERSNLSLDFPVVLFTVKRVGSVHIIYALINDENDNKNLYKVVKYEVKL